MKGRDAQEFSNIHARLLDDGFDLSGFDKFNDALEYKSIYFKKDGKEYRFLADPLELHVGDNNFDRWANSVGDIIYFKKLSCEQFFRKLEKITSVSAYDESRK